MAIASQYVRSAAPKFAPGGGVDVIYTGSRIGTGTMSNPDVGSHDTEDLVPELGVEVAVS